MVEKHDTTRQRVSKNFFVPWEQYYEEVDTEPVNCVLCGSPEYVSVGKEHLFEIRKCMNCGMVYVSPQPTEDGMAAFYESFYEDIQEPRSFGEFEAQVERIIRKRQPDGRMVLDVGCGLGTFLKHISGKQRQLYGVDLSERAIAQARVNVPEAHLLVSKFTEDFFPSIQFDCITMLAVLEHAKDPKSVVKNLFDKLRPGGTMIILVPYIYAFFKLSQRFSFLPTVPFEAPRHLLDFSPQTLSRLMRECGLVNVKTNIARPYCGQNFWVRIAIWMVKIPGILLHFLSGGLYIYPFAGSIVVYGEKESPAPGNNI